MRDKIINFILRQTRRRHPLRYLIIPVLALVFLSLVTLLTLAGIQVDAWLHLPELLIFPYNIIFSCPVLFAGIVLIFWCNYLFIQAGGTPVPLDPPKLLVEKGPYAIIRNPMITGLFLLIMGIGLFSDSKTLVVFIGPFFLILNAIELKFIEEPELERRLGEVYVSYKKRTPMFIPKLNFRKRN